MTLLTVGEQGNETIGGTADVYLEVKPGTGRVFIDSFPLTRIDTQLSARFANEVACDFLKADCSDRDFFYTIRAKSSVVGGPSAGAALAVLTVAVLKNEKLNDSVIITGTINSGGIIGPVAGIQEKVDAAKKAGFREVLIPKRSIVSGEEYILNLSNSSKGSINYSALSKNIVYADSYQVDGIRIVPVSTLEDALYEFTGEKYPDHSYNVTVPAEYNAVMRNISLNLCGRASDIKAVITGETKKKKEKLYNSSLEFLGRANASFSQGDYYSAASFCFNAGSQLRSIEYSTYSEEDLELVKKSAEQDAERMLGDTNKRDLATMPELETSMIVKERLLEAKDILGGNDSLSGNDLAYVVERVYSAKAWSAFFDYPGKKVELDQAHLGDACLSKIAEAEERVNYIEMLFGQYADARKEISDTKQLYEDGDYTYCLFKASRIKADANAVLSSLSVTDEKMPELIDDQLRLARIQINKQGDNFPILGYSYYDYASSLRDSRPELSVLFSEYAFEFSNLDMYFPKEKTTVLPVDREQAGIFMLGLSAGMLVTVLLLFLIGKYSRMKKKKERAK